MIIQCPACNTRFAVKPTAIPEQGRKVRCAKCQHRWFQGPLVAHANDMDEQPERAPEDNPARDFSMFIEENGGESTFHMDDMPSFTNSPQRMAVQPTTQHAPGWMKYVAASLAIFGVLGGMVVFQDSVRALPMMDVAYGLMGMRPTDGLVIAEADVQILPGRQQTSYFIKGSVKNTTDEERMMPVLRITLADAEGLPVSSTDYGQEDLRIMPGEAVPFSAELKHRSTRVQQVVLDVGNGLQLKLR
jgi:predicted Zn finger-like uncharacterized protein